MVQVVFFGVLLTNTENIFLLNFICKCKWFLLINTWPSLSMIGQCRMSMIGHYRMLMIGHCKVSVIGQCRMSYQKGRE